MAEYSRHKKHKHLRHNGRRQKRSDLKDNRGTLMQSVSIEQRPKLLAKCKRRGDIEVDLMMGSNHRSALLVMNDRATMVTVLVKLEGKQVAYSYHKLRKRLSNFNS